jgi:hypothetical protein
METYQYPSLSGILENRKHSMRHLKLILVIILALISQIGQSQVMEAPEWKAEIQETIIVKGNTITPNPSILSTFLNLI